MHLFYTVLIHCRDIECSKATSRFTGGNVTVMQLDRHPIGAEKVRQHVAFPDELDLRSWMHPESPDLAEDTSLMYDLVSIVVHKGKAHSAGHYVAVCRLAPAGGICPLHANEACPHLPQAVASVGCTVCCACVPDVAAECACYVVCCSSIHSVLAWPGPPAFVRTSTSTHDDSIAGITDS